jgi:hypothetical protein
MSGKKVNQGQIENHLRSMISALKESLKRDDLEMSFVAVG